MKRDRLWMAYQNSQRLLFGLLAVTVLGVGCTKASMYHSRFTPTDLAPEDAVTVVLSQFSGEFSAAKEAKFVRCITKAIHKAHPTVRIVPADEFRQAAFPGLPPEEIPPGDSTWDQLVDDPAYGERIAPLGLHYLIAVSGGTTDDREFLTLTLAMQTGRRHSQLEATVLDLKQGSKAGYFWVSASNVTFVSATETRACSELGEGVAKFLAGEKPPEEMKADQLEEEIREGWERTKDEDQQAQFIGHGYAPTPFE